MLCALQGHAGKLHAGSSQPLSAYIAQGLCFIAMGFLKAIWPILLLHGLLEPPEKLLTFAEGFAGEHAWSRGMQVFGYDGRTFDMRLSELHNFMRPAGFIAMIATVMAMHKGAVLWLGTPCSTWVFMSRHSTGRRIDILGNLESPYIRAQNALISRVCYIIVLAMKRGVYWIIEQPDSSIVWQHPLMARVLSRYSHLISEARGEMGAFSLETPKASVFKGTAPYLSELARRMSPEERNILRTRLAKTETTKQYIDGKGKKRCVGTAALKSTQCYSFNFGLAHALAYFNSCNAEAVAALPGNDLNPSDSEDEPLVTADDSLIDIRQSRPEYWHDNAAGEKQLKLKRKRM